MFFIQVTAVNFNSKVKTVLFQVTTVQKGGYFGELALVTHKPRAATVKAEGDVRVACKHIKL